jgi:hypothetical protein
MKPEYLSKFPHGKIPALDGADGFKLFEGMAIARYGKSEPLPTYFILASVRLQDEIMLSLSS